MPRFRVLPYRAGSRSASALAEALGGRVLRLRGSTFVPRNDDVLINWGNTEGQQVPGVGRWGSVKNPPANIRTASNKLQFFRLMAREDADIIPEFWTNQRDIPDDAFPIVCRTVLAGHSGAGIVIANRRADLVAAPLYVKYIKKQDEYRIHVGRRRRLVGGGDHGEGIHANETVLISVQRKARREGFENPNWQIRNHNNGFVFVRGGVNPPECVVDVARRALSRSGLDFGAVDVIYNERSRRAYVLEINTAPGLEGQTVEDYANFFRGPAR